MYRVLIPLMLLAANALAQQQPVWPPHPTESEGTIVKIQGGDVCTRIFMSDGSVWAIVPDNFDYLGRIAMANTYWLNQSKIYLHTSDYPGNARFLLPIPPMVPCHDGGSVGIGWVPNAAGLYVE